MRRIVAFAADELDAGEVRRISIAGAAPIAVYRLEDGWFATDDACTHGEASLADGLVEGDRIVCPFHLGAFDIRTGAPVAPPCHVGLRTYAVEVEGDSIVVVLGE